MRTITATADIDLSPDEVWKVLIDFDRWPEMTASITALESVSDVPPGVGFAVRIEQPKLRPAVWTVTDWSPARAFTWATRSPGTTVTAVHRIEPRPSGCAIRLETTFAGPLSTLAGWIAGSLTQRYMQMEADGLKAACERR